MISSTDMCLTVKEVLQTTDKRALTRFTSLGQKRRKKKLTYFAGIFVITGFLGHWLQSNIQLFNDSIDVEQFMNTDTLATNSLHNLIISSYFKGGGGVIGSTVNSQESTFYSHDPLFLLSEWQYYRNNTHKCAFLSTKCGEASINADVAIEKMNAVFSCDIPTLIGDFYHPYWDNGGAAWVDYRKCLSGNHSKDECTENLRQECLKSPSRIIKTDRLSLAMLEPFLANNENLAVMHVFRDPRGVINHNLQNLGFRQLSSLSAIKDYAETVCSRMNEDLTVGKTLALKYPRQFKMMLFEDFLSDTEGLLRLILRFAGIPFKVKSVEKTRIENYAMEKAMHEFNVPKTDISIEHNNLVITIPETVYNETSETHKIKRKILDIERYVHPFHWRTDLDYSVFQAIDSVCSPVYTKLGYNTYPTTELLRQIDRWPSFGPNGIYPLF